MNIARGSRRAGELTLPARSAAFVDVPWRLVAEPSLVRPPQLAPECVPVMWIIAMAVVSFGLPATAQTLAERPDARPVMQGRIVATRYPNAGVELFWDRAVDDRGVIGYEIRRNGASRGTRDVLSDYDPSLASDREYVFEVVAIDTAGQRSEPATVSLPLGVDSASRDAGPSEVRAPAGLRASVYSPTAAELFWEREPAVLGLRYEVRRDGRVVGATDGISYFTNSLVAGTGYVFSVVAIDTSGRRSAPARVPVGTPEPAAAVPARPAGLRAAVYSETALELFWERDGGPTRRYEIRRDGDIVGTTDGTSFFDDALDPGTAYRYRVIALEGGHRSEPSSLSLTTNGEPMQSGAGGQSLIDTATRDALLVNVLAVIDGGVYGPFYDEIERELLDGPGRRVTSDSLADGVRTVVSTCRDGGRTTERISGGAQTLVVEFEANACRIGEREFAGSLRTDREFDIVDPPRIESDRVTCTSGRLVVEAADGSRLVLDAANGDPSAVSLLVESNGSSAVFTVPVGDRLQIPCTADRRPGESRAPACALETGLVLDAR